MYATVEDIEKRLGRTFNETERTACESLLKSAKVTIDAYNEKASDEAKEDVTISIVLRVVGNMGADLPIGATQGSMSALGYAQSWTMSNGATGELYLSKRDKKVLGIGDKIGTHSLLEDLC